MTIGYSLLTILYVKIDKNVRGKQPQVAVNILTKRLSFLLSRSTATLTQRTA